MSRRTDLPIYNIIMGGGGNGGGGNAGIFTCTLTSADVAPFPTKSYAATEKVVVALVSIINCRVVAVVVALTAAFLVSA